MIVRVRIGTADTLIYVPVNQTVAGTTELAAASTLNRHKVIGAMLVMSATGTLRFTDGVNDLTGPADVVANGGFVMPTSMIPWTESGAVNRAINLVTTVGAARGVVVLVTEP